MNGENPYHRGTTLTNVYNQTIEREERLLELRYNVKTIWEHDFKRLRQTSQMQHFLNTHEVITDLNTTDSFFGRKVEGFKLFRKAEENKKFLLRFYKS